MKYCKQCGAQLDDDEIFCTACGAKYEENESISNADEVKNKKFVNSSKRGHMLRTNGALSPF